MTGGGSRRRANNGSERMSAIWELPERPKSIHKAHKFMLKYEGAALAQSILQPSRQIDARAAFLPVESIWPWDGSQELTTGQNAREHGRKRERLQRVTLAQADASPADSTILQPRATFRDHAVHFTVAVK
jgi:hypothetical protein